MSKGSNPRVTTSSSSGVDPTTAAYIQAYRQRAGALAGQDDSGLRSTFTDALNYGLGSDPLSGLDQFMNPYTKNVVDTTNADFDRQAAMAKNAADAEATRAGAFNSDRAGVLEANSLNNVNMNRASTLAGLRSSGYTNAVQQLLQSKGFDASLGLQGIMGLNQNAISRLYGMTPGFTPISTQGTSTQETQTNSDPFSTLLGLGLGIGSFGIGGGATLGGSLLSRLFNIKGGGGGGPYPVDPNRGLA